MRGSFPESIFFPIYKQRPLYLLVCLDSASQDPTPNAHECKIKFNEPQTSNLTLKPNKLSSPRTWKVNFIHSNANSKVVQPSVAWQMNFPQLTPLNKHWQAKRKQAFFFLFFFNKSFQYSGLQIPYLQTLDKDKTCSSVNIWNPLYL